MKPWLEAKRDQSFPDPVTCKSQKEFLHQATTASLFKKVVAGILIYVHQQEETLSALNKKKYGKPDQKFRIGTEKGGK